MWTSVIHESERGNSFEGTRQISSVTSGESVLKFLNVIVKREWRLFNKNLRFC